MTGTDKIKQKILEDARAKAADIEAQAQQEADEIIEQAQKEAAVKSADALKKAETDGQEIYRRLLSVAALEGRKEILRAKQDMVDSAFQLALDKIINLPDHEYQKLVEDMIVNAATKGNGEILLSERDKKRMSGKFLANINKRVKNKGIGGSFTMSNDSIKTAGGFILKFGDMEINSTFEILFEMIRPELEGEVVRILFSA